MAVLTLGYGCTCIFIYCFHVSS